MGLKDVVFDKGVEVVQDVLGLGGETNNANSNDRAPSEQRQNARDNKTYNNIISSQNNNNKEVIENGYDSNSNDGVLQGGEQDNNQYSNQYSSTNESYSKYT
ncbi:hypothetical protein SAMD00019534_010920 [Acytostelium subglobosum LB1]|uniref:hypothetical protein n=1 Tax=Acytostelium subglobosum LB1 TaxID=1410327 RepID=UPI000644CA7A|nr:hypothetical protein SAMD00019534_010920 [Acytostelium subglobosum LB1]GAM17917.1 hypothetical protein SAMD00019534_010920 [Acytostelium subglobosum LB1]|eukprot:XP_012758513.1 hypothetical protein SAMD00019534_010920 [Acytostelium subglobosum LB1]